MERTIHITNINYNGINKTGAKRNSVEAELRLYNKNNHDCFSASASIWYGNHSDIYMGGQCFDELKDIPEVAELPIFKEIYDLWKNYHLNDLHAGTKAQEDILREAVKNGELKSYGASAYEETCAYLESKDMLYDKNYLVEKTQKDGTVENVPYKYGSGWLIEDIPEQALLRMKSLINDGKIYEPEAEKSEQNLENDYDYER